MPLTIVRKVLALPGRKLACWGAAVATLTSGALLYSCGAGNPKATGHGIATPLDVQAAGVVPVTASNAGTPAIGTSIDFDSLVPLLALPELESVAEAMDAEAAELAFTTYRAVLAQELLELAPTPPYQFLLGQLADSAQQPLQAAEAFKRCGAAEWALKDYCAYFAARVLVRAGSASAALGLLGPNEPDIVALKPWWLTLRGEAAMNAKRLPEAQTALTQALAYEEESTDRTRRTFLLADAVIAASGSGDSHEAAVLAALRAVRRVLFTNAGSNVANQASERETKLLALLSAESFRLNQPPTLEDHVTLVSSLVGQKQFESAKLAAEEVLARPGNGSQFTKPLCELRLLRNKALAGLKQWGLATDGLAEAASRCQDEDFQARALFVGSKYARYDKRWAQSAQLCKRLEEVAPRHRLADDARLLRAEAHLMMSDDAEYTRLLSTFAEDYPQGDMVLDGVSDLALRLMTKGQWSEAVHVLERGQALANQADRTRDHEYAGRERYLLARSLIKAGESERGLAQYEALIRERPLSYYMQHAYARLHAFEPERAQRVRSEALSSAEKEPFRFQRRPEFDTTDFARVVELLRLGQVDWAQRELDVLSKGEKTVASEVLWSTALLYARAGYAQMAHSLARGKLTDWLNQWPVGEWRQAWELAFPRPFLKHASKEAERNGLSEALVFAIMREESGFDTRAHSGADAYGLMQLIEPTAQHFGKELKLPSSPRALFNPRVNIALGARALAAYSARFPDNRLLGVPSYNAGPGRPTRWLKELATRDFDLWVELIPFRETRRYTKRVLASYGVYSFLYGNPNDPVLFPLTVTQR
jgi:soluble lytic murein transglycosylase